MSFLKRLAKVRAVFSPQILESAYLEDCQLVKSCDIEKWPYESSGSTS
jgi:hypothetical protein